MSEAKDSTGCVHCDHLSHTLTVHPPIEVYVCCQCGRRREHRTEMSGGSLGGGKHGPFAPDVRPYFGGPHE